jgi:hypothetical protein
MIIAVFKRESYQKINQSGITYKAMEKKVDILDWNFKFLILLVLILGIPHRSCVGERSEQAPRTTSL